jgi:hypothetical protein
VAQLGARFHGMEEVVGSIPTRSTKSFCWHRTGARDRVRLDTAIHQGATMKMKALLLVLGLLVSSFASATDKYVSNEFGFAASFPADVIHTQITPDVNSFVANGPGGAWVAQVKVTNNVAMPREVTKEFMEAKLGEVLRDGGMTQTGASSYTTFRGYPAVLATATFIIDNRHTQHVEYPVVVDMKLIFVKDQNLIKGQNRVYWVAGWAIQGGDRSRIQQFLDSFELR